MRLGHVVIRYPLAMAMGTPTQVKKPRMQVRRGGQQKGWSILPACPAPSSGRFQCDFGMRAQCSPTEEGEDDIQSQLLILCGLPTYAL